MTSRLPVLFVGHGSPMNAIENNAFTAAWESLGASLPRPEAIAVVSAHWYTRGLFVTDAPKLKMVYDMFGFPEELYRVQYPAPGAPEMARRASALAGAAVDNTWGLDHGAWSVLCRMFPKAECPVFEISVDGAAPAEKQFETGRKLAALRENGVLLLGSGNVVHNLRAVKWEMARGGLPWAEEFDAYVKEAVLRRDFDAVVRFEQAGDIARRAVPTPDHFYPLLTVLGAASPDDGIEVVNDACTLGSLSMTSYRIG